MKKINKQAMYDALARHTQAFPLSTNPEFNSTKKRVANIMLIKAETDDEIELLNDAIEIAENEAQVIVDAENLQNLKPIWEQELVEEIAGHNRPAVITELENNIASVPAL